MPPKKQRTEELATRVGGVDTNYLASYVEEDKSLDLLKEFVTLPRLKIIQGMTDQTLKDQFGEGAIILRPSDALICKANNSFLFVPQFFFPEWCKWADRRDKESPMILDRTFDENHDIARRAKDKNRRFEVYEGQSKKPPENQWKYRYVEHLNFPGVLYGDHPLAGTQCVLSFSRGEYSVGSNFIQAVRLQRETINGEPRRVPLWAQVWEFTSAHRNQGDKSWWGLDFHPADPSRIQPEEAPQFKTSFEELMSLHEAKRIRAEYDDSEETEVSSSGKDY